MTALESWYSYETASASSPVPKVVIMSSKLRICEVGDGQDWTALDRHRANARLITAAPELLAELEACAVTLEELAAYIRLRGDNPDLVLERARWARIAIAKAVKKRV